MSLDGKYVFATVMCLFLFICVTIWSAHVLNMCLINQNGVVCGCTS